MQIGLWISALIFLWTGSAYFIAGVLARKPDPKALPPEIGQLTVTLFGASALGLMTFSLLLTIAAIIEWQSLRRDARKEVEMAEVLERRMTRLEKELKGRMHAITGLVIGSLHSNPLTEEQDPQNEDYIAEALFYSQKGYKTLRELEGDGKYMALNNILYYSCLLGDEARRDTVLAQVRDIREVIERYEDSQYIAPYVMTYCRVMLTFVDNVDELKLAKKKVESLEKNLTSLQRKEAAMLAASLDRKLRVLNRQGG
jgi:hypothetical protein